MIKLKLPAIIVLHICCTFLLTAQDREQAETEYKQAVLNIEEIYNIFHKELPVLLPEIEYKSIEIIEPEESIETEPVTALEPEKDKEPEKEAEIVLDINAEVEEFVITEEIYDKTFTEVQRLILELNSIIQKRDFIRWKLYLTEEYIATMSSKETLEGLSQKEVLRKNGIKLESLKDYFNFVVVPSRSNARLNELLFEEETKVKAMMKIEGTSIILYQLEKIADKWKVSIW